LEENEKMDIKIQEKGKKDKKQPGTFILIGYSESNIKIIENHKIPYCVVENLKLKKESRVI